ncbi:sensor domain-containing diguanylate cyclase [Undibacterium sp. FT147W]|uniref:Sensor domain-containing diguanylate cyclase n=1 Tax=Undibacterium rivi TaxID=2828729 RepID=A0ABS5GZH1_9BURK|nr:sensor domain-containing diguanylate cyclase [Undibacterium rivi]MBR7791858.1 sensor domain-containing diguanylate cyclase [Undibacterium rivi]
MRQLIRNNIAIRSSLALLGVSLIIGIFFSLASYVYFFDDEQKHTISTMQDLLNSAENTASIACYLSDKNLANEVVNGISKNNVVSKVTIHSGKTMLAVSQKTSIPTSFELPFFFKHYPDFISREIFSPFNPREKVCTVNMEINQATVNKNSTEKALFIVELLLFQNLLIASVLSLIVFVFFTRPIKIISDRLHALSPQKGELLKHPENNKENELGRLVNDVNQIIADLVSSLDEEKNLRLQHALEERKFQTFFENAETGIFKMNGKGELLSYNQALTRMLSIATDNGSPSAALLDLISGQELRLHLMIDAALNESRVVSEDFCIEPGRLKEKKWINIVLHAAENDLLQGLINDITERKYKEEAAQQLAITDHLTGLNNRLGLERKLAYLMKENAHGHPSPFFLLLIDLDKFKEVNDTYGHKAGDLVLIHFSTVLTNILRKTDFIARLGGDEFVVLLCDMTDQEKAIEIAGKIITEACRPIDVGHGISASTGASIGINYASGGIFSAEKLLAETDLAMYEAKQSGRSAYAIARYESSPDQAQSI